MKENQKIVLRGHEYATPRTESVEIKNQGVLCGSGASGSCISKLGVGGNA